MGARRAVSTAEAEGPLSLGGGDLRRNTQQRARRAVRSFVTRG